MMFSVTAKLGSFSLPLAMGDDCFDGDLPPHREEQDQSEVVPGLDEQLIDQEELRIATAREQLATRASNRERDMLNEIARSANKEKIAARQATERKASQPDICRCVSGQVCHLGIHRPAKVFNSKQIDTRSKIGRIDC
jgi:hypothetical protein